MRKHPLWQNISLESRNKKRFTPLQDTQDEVLDKEAKTDIEKEISTVSSTIV